MSGLFITLEGPEGSGKSTQSRRLVERLRADGRRTVVATREPGGTPLGDELRTLLLRRPAMGVGPVTQALLMNAARAEHVETLIRPALERGEVVVCDRFADSTLAYQGYGLGLPLEQLEQVVAFATGGCAPALTLLVDLPIEDGLDRKRVQAQVSGSEWNRYEAETLQFHQRVRNGYHALVRADADRWRVLDGRLSEGELAAQIWEHVQPFLQPSLSL